MMSERDDMHSASKVYGARGVKGNVRSKSRKLRAGTGVEDDDALGRCSVQSMLALRDICCTSLPTHVEFSVISCIQSRQ